MNENITSSGSSINYDGILEAFNKFKSIGPRPIFTVIYLSRTEYDLLAAQAGTVTDRTPIGIRFSINPYLPAHMACAYDTEGNLWIIDLRTPEKMHNLGPSKAVVGF